MKRLLGLTQYTLKYLLSQKFIIIFFIIFPIAFTYFMSFMQNNGNSSDLTKEKINITIVNNGNEKLGETYKQIFTSENMNEIIGIADEEKADVVVEIEEGAEKKLEKGEEIHLKFTNKNSKISISTAFLESVLNEINQNISEGVNLSLAVNQNKISKDLALKIYNEIGKIQPAKFNIKAITLPNSLSEIEKIIPGIICSFILFNIMVTGTAIYFKDIDEGVLQRKVSTPNSRLFIFSSYTVYAWLLGVIVTGIYLAFMKVSGLAFKNTPVHYLVVYTLIYSVFCALSSSLLLGFKDKMKATFVSMALFFIQTSLAGDFNPNQREALKDLAVVKYSPLRLVRDAAESLVNGGDYIIILKSFLVPLAFSVVLFFIGYSLSAKSWGRKK